MLQKRQTPPDPDHGWWRLVVVTVGVFAVMLVLVFLVVWWTRS